MCLDGSSYNELERYMTRQIAAAYNKCARKWRAEQPRIVEEFAILSQYGPIRRIFFDFAGTLAYNDPPRAAHYLRLCTERGIFLERRDIWTALREVWATVDSVEGIAHPEASRDAAAYNTFRAGLEEQILKKLGVHTGRSEIIEELLSIQDDPKAYTLYPETRATLSRLQDTGYRLCLVSNFTWGLPDLVTELGLAPYFPTVITSARVGYRKPHPKIYEAALAAMEAKPAETLFVGDSFEADIRGSTNYGFHAVLVDRRSTGRHQWPSIAVLTELLELVEVPSDHSTAGVFPVPPDLALQKP